MKAATGALRAVLVGAALALASPGAAQAPDGFVLPWGRVRLSVGGQYSAHDTRFAAGGGREPLTADLNRALTPAAFAPLRPLDQRLGQFLAATAARTGSSRTVVNPDTLSLGVLDLRAEENLVHWPMELAVGVLPRVELGVRVPLVRGERLLQRTGLANGTVGINPDSVGNAALLRRIDEQWSALGRSRFLPTGASPLGRELQRRVRALAGDSLRLPASAFADTLFLSLLGREFPAAPLGSGVDPWRLGDSEVSARVLLLSTMGTAAYPADSTGVHLRSSATLTVRLATGMEPDTVQLIPLAYELGRSGYSGTLSTDLFVGRLLWVTGAARYAVQRPVEVLRHLVPADGPFSQRGAPQRVRLHPGTQLDLWLAPRIRLAEAISLGVEYNLASVGGTRIEEVRDDTLTAPTAAGVEGRGTVQRVGAGVRFSTLPAYSRGESRLPAEVELAFATTLAGPQRHPAASLATVSLRLFPRLWGGRRPRDPDPRPTPP